MMELEKLKPTAASTIIVCAASFFSMQLMIFLLKPTLFFRLDTFRLIIVGLGLATPILLVNIIFFRISDNRKLFRILMTGKEENEKIVWATAGFYSVLIIALVTLLGYSYHFTLYKSLWIIFWIEFVMMVLGIIASTVKPDKTNVRH